VVCSAIVVVVGAIIIIIGICVRWSSLVAEFLFASPFGSTVAEPNLDSCFRQSCTLERDCK